MTPLHRRQQHLKAPWEACQVDNVEVTRRCEPRERLSGRPAYAAHVLRGHVALELSMAGPQPSTSASLRFIPPVVIRTCRSSPPGSPSSAWLRWSPRVALRCSVPLGGSASSTHPTTRVLMQIQPGPDLAQASPSRWRIRSQRAEGMGSLPAARPRWTHPRAPVENG